MIKPKPLLTYNALNDLGIWSDDKCVFVIYCDCFDFTYHYVLADFSSEKEDANFCQIMFQTLNAAKRYLDDNKTESANKI